ncbi:MAG: hypothetical protein AAGH89_11865, partial [Verrucomicrobiota bacterium]
NGQATSILAQFNPLSTAGEGFTFQRVDGTPMTMLEVYHALLRPEYTGTNIFQNVFGDQEDEDNEGNGFVPDPTAEINGSETQEILVDAEAKPATELQLVGLFEAFRSLEKPTIFAGVQMGESLQNSIPMVAGSGNPGEEFTIRVLEGKTYRATADEDGNWTCLLAESSLENTLELEIQSGANPHELHVYEVESAVSENVLAQLGDEIKSGDMVGKVITVAV